MEASIINPDHTVLRDQSDLGSYYPKCIRRWKSRRWLSWKVGKGLKDMTCLNNKNIWDFHLYQKFFSYPCYLDRTDSLIIGCIGTHEHGHQVTSMFSQSDVIMKQMEECTDRWKLCWGHRGWTKHKWVWPGNATITDHKPTYWTQNTYNHTTSRTQLSKATRPEVIKPFLCPTLLSMEFHLFVERKILKNSNFFQLASYLEGGPLMWMMPLHLNQKSD